MSYEGYVEYICVKGHLFARDCYSDEPAICIRCRGKVAYIHPVDETNGIDEDDPGTFSGDVEIVGEEDTWHRDHYGNKYATRITLVSPNSKVWRKI